MKLLIGLLIGYFLGLTNLLTFYISLINGIEQK